MTDRLQRWTVELNRDPEVEDGPAIDIFIANTYEAEAEAGRARRSTI